MLTIEHESKVKSICDMLNADDKGMQWTLQNSTISREDGARIIFIKDINKEKLTISGLAPKGSYGPANVTIKSIGTSSLRSAEEIYKAVKNRLLSEYLPKYEQQRAAAIKAEEAEKKLLAAIKSIVSEFKLANNGCCSSVYFGEGKASGRAESTGRDISVYLTGLNPEQLRVIVAAIHKS